MDFSRFKKYLERFVARAQEIDEEFTEDWRAKANRRSVVIIIVVGGIALISYVFFIAPPATFPVGTLVTVPEGSSARETGTLLEQQGVVRNGTAFSIAVTILGADRGVRAGDYLFKEPRTLFSIARAITTGAYGLEPIKIRIPEGATTADMAKLYSAELQRFDSEKFLEKAKPMEGYLFADTYFFLPNATEDVVIRTMRQNFDTNIASLAGDIETFGKPLADVVTMASILEKEAFTMDDRRMIAGVLWRRIKMKMPLQVDAAFLYSLGRTTFSLTKEDLQNKDDPYNTYTHTGLPPTPIGSPSLSSLKAAVTPIDKGYLFYLADHNHITHYAKTYEEHLRNKALYLGS